MSTTDCGCKETTGCDCFGNGITIPNGPAGDNGLSAYDVWIANGNTGDYTAFLLSLQGVKGEDSTVPGPPGPPGTIVPLVWNTLTMNGTFNSSGSPNVAQYCIDPYGYLRFRGRVHKAGSAFGTISDMSAILVATTKSYEFRIKVTNDGDEENGTMSSSRVLSANYNGDEPLELMTIPAIYILD